MDLWMIFVIAYFLTLSAFVLFAVIRAVWKSGQ